MSAEDVRAAPASDMPPTAVDDELSVLLVEAFLGSYDDIRLSLADAVDAGDLDVVAAGSHRLKGELGVLGAMEAHEAAAALERAARTGDPASVGAAWREFTRVVDGEVVPGLRASAE